MPVVKRRGGSLLSVFADYNPRLMSNGQIRMMCPFRENHPDGGGRMSFFATPEINGYLCFSCGSHGNLARLLNKDFGVSYFEALSMVRLSDYKKEKAEFDLDVIWDFRVPPKEFLERGYEKGTLSHFRVGIADDGAILIPYYKSFDKPVELIGYQKRWYSPYRKVRNSAGFNKKEYLYNLDYSKDYVVITEGQSDVWRLWQHGYNSCAVMGSDISIEQIGMLSGFKKIYLALDNDSAGRRGTEILYHSLKNYSEVMLVPYDAKDPGECLSKDGWETAFAASTDYVAYSLEMSLGWDGYLDMRDEVLEELKHRISHG